MDQSGKPFYKDDEIVCDRDGIPHYTGVQPHLMREYRRRVLFAYNNLEGEGDDATKEARDLGKKQSRFAKRLIDALHGEAWRACEELLEDPVKLKEKDGYKHVFACLQSIEKVGVLKKMEAFDNYFKKTYRQRGTPIDLFLRRRSQAWSELIDVAEGVSMSEDLRAYFLLEQVNIGREERRSILLANQSNYTIEGIEKVIISHLPRKARAMERSAHYAHAMNDEEIDGDEEAFALEDDEQEFLDPELGLDEEAFEVDDTLPSDDGGSQDEEIYEAFTVMDNHRKTYKDSRRKLREIQKSRGYFRGDFTGDFKGEMVEERRQAVAAEKARTRCAACGRLGHWAGDSACAKSSKSGPQRGSSSSKGKKKGGGKDRAYMVGEAPLYFTLGSEEEYEEAFCNMVSTPVDEEETEMQQDGGLSDLDFRRKKAVDARSETHSEAASVRWEKIEDSYGAAAPTTPWGSTELPAADLRAGVQTLQVPSFAEVRPSNLEDMKLRDLQAECEAWGIHISGKKADLKERLEKLFMGQLILRKGCTTKYVRLKLMDGSPKRATKGYAGAVPDDQAPIRPKSKAAAKPMPRVLREALHGLQAPEGPKEPKVKAPPPQRKIHDDGADTFRSLSDERLFRRDLETRLAEAAVIAAEERLYTEFLDPRTGIRMPSVFKVGEMAPSVYCPACGQPMVLRRNKRDDGLFFGCSRFNAGCRGTRRFEDVVEEYEGRQQKQSPSSSGLVRR
ncbi:unnamed protein product [Durusdinium trenchii]|uniref:SAP domain-containing protein n=1 Tax=Durusdinium trenchii TaxID=1381693 RepID=A0ABP0M177_9DINO